MARDVAKLKAAIDAGASAPPFKRAPRRNELRGRPRAVVRCLGCGGDRERNERCLHCDYAHGDGPGFADTDEQGDY